MIIQLNGRGLQDMTRDDDMGNELGLSLQQRLK